MSDPMTPRTAAGRSLLLRMTTRDTQDLRPAEVIIAAIEAESVASWLASPEAEEVLARAMSDALLEFEVLDDIDWKAKARAALDGILAALRGESDG